MAAEIFIKGIVRHLEPPPALVSMISKEIKVGLPSQFPIAAVAQIFEIAPNSRHFRRNLKVGEDVAKPRRNPGNPAAIAAIFKTLVIRRSTKNREEKKKSRGERKRNRVLKGPITNKRADYTNNRPNKGEVLIGPDKGKTGPILPKKSAQ